MAFVDPIGDMITRIRNAQMRMLENVKIPGSKFRERILPERHRGLALEYDLWFNTNEIHTIRSWLYTDFMGNGLLFKINSVKINEKLFKSIVTSDIKVDEERLDKIINNFCIDCRKIIK